MIWIRPGSAEDKLSVHRLLDACAMSDEINLCECLVAEVGGEIIGLARIEQGGGKPFVRPIAVASMHQRHGIGRRLLVTLQKDVPELWVIARGAVVDFHSKHGFLAMDWEFVYEPFRDECDTCIHRVACDPMPMRYCAPVREQLD
jgi:N-acetylglutamate synthase-like GNAT family acetyltransferase